MNIKERTHQNQRKNGTGEAMPKEHSMPYKRKETVWQRLLLFSCFSFMNLQNYNFKLTQAKDLYHLLFVQIYHMRSILIT